MFNIMEEPRRISIEFTSKMRNVDRVILETRHFLEKCGSCETLLEFNIVLRELLINAIEHGNLNIPEKEVRMAVDSLGSGLFSITVQDEGKGFVHRELKLAIPEDPRQVRSRGLPLVHEFTEEMEFNEQGNCVKVLIRLNHETDFRVEEQDGWQIIRPSGDITATGADKLDSLLTRLVARDNHRFRFDFQKVQDLDSICLSVLVVLARTLAEKGGQLEIINAGREVVELFRITRLDVLYRIVSD